MRWCSDHELQSRVLLNRRLVSLYAFDGGPRDLRFSTQKNKLVSTASATTVDNIALSRSWCTPWLRAERGGLGQLTAFVGQLHPRVRDSRHTCLRGSDRRVHQTACDREYVACTGPQEEDEPNIVHQLADLEPSALCAPSPCACRLADYQLQVCLTIEVFLSDATSPLSVCQTAAGPFFKPYIVL